MVANLSYNDFKMMSVATLRGCACRHFDSERTVFFFVFHVKYTHILSINTIPLPDENLRKPVIILVPDAEFFYVEFIKDMTTYEASSTAWTTLNEMAS